LNKKIFILLSLIIVIFGIVPVLAETDLPSIERTTVNGMTLFAQKTDSSLVEVTLILKSGTGLEQKKGVAIIVNQFVSGILNYYQKKLGWVGASVETYPDYTMVKIQSSPKRLKSVLKVLGDLLVYPLYDYDFASDLKNLISTDLKATSSITKAYYDFNREFYGAEHPYDNDLDAESLKSITGNDVFKWHRLTYRPGNAILSISGGFKERLKTLEKLFRDLPSGIIDNRLMVKPVTLNKIRRIEEVDLNVKVASIAMGYAAPRMKDPEFPAFKIIAHYLEEHQHYFEELRVKEGLIYAGFVYYNYLEKPNAPNIAFLTMTEPSLLNRVETRTVEVLKELAEKGLEQEKIASVIEAIKINSSIKRVEGRGLATINALSYYLDTQLVYDQKLLLQLERVTTADIQKAAVKYFQNYIRVAYLPKKKNKTLK
jgi:predicted Zn-dependent peptidase